jgi:hypothetical protein
MARAWPGPGTAAAAEARLHHRPPAPAAASPCARGRLNVLVHLLGKPLGALCSEMEGLQSEFKVGDVKYHLGQSGALQVDSPGGARAVQLSIAPNPSHLEAVCPVVLGMVRADQARRAAAAAAAAAGEPGGGEHDARWAAATRAVMGLLIHGDAAFSGLGLAAETLQLSDLPGYSTGGAVHVVVNNQVGPWAGRRHARRRCRSLLAAAAPESKMLCQSPRRSVAPARPFPLSPLCSLTCPPPHPHTAPRSASPRCRATGAPAPTPPTYPASSAPPCCTLTPTTLRQWWRRSSSRRTGGQGGTRT